MATIILRSIKGSPLSNSEVDANFNNLNLDLSAKLAISDYTAADVLAKLSTVDGAGSGLDTDLVRSLATASALPGGADKSSVVVRDSSGNFGANILTASSFVGNVSGNVSGTAVNITGIAAIANGGTGGADAVTARSNLNVDEAGTAVALAIALG